ncbi:MAG TPA: carbon-nitrogen hydrolase family protein [Chloroflexota bacterium]|nr:carbon-nitrogen hydrolase family protein [Chloroflexota bacterium]
MSRTRIACAQVATVDGEVAANIARCYDLAERAVDDGAELVALPELAATGYCADDYAPYVEPLDCPAVARFRQIAAQGPAVILVGLVIADEHGRPQNAAVLVGPDGPMGTYAKIHLCINALPRVDESSRFVAGSGLGLFDTPVGRLGVMICYDGHHPELARALTIEGADLLVWINNRSTIEPWEAQAIAKFNMVPVALVNRVGEAGWEAPDESQRRFPGRSAISDHSGNLLSWTEDGLETNVVADIDLEAGRRCREDDISLNTIASRRPDLYADTLSRLPGRPGGTDDCVR